MAYTPGMTVYTAGTVEIPGIGSDYTIKWKFICNGKTSQGTIATHQSAEIYKWSPPNRIFLPLFGNQVKGELHIYVYPNGSSTMGFGDYSYILVLDPTIAPKIERVSSILTGKIYNNKAISLYTTVGLSIEVAKVVDAAQTVTISDGRVSYQVNVESGEGYTEIVQTFSTYTVPDDATNEYTDVNFSISAVDSRGRKAIRTFTERIYKYIKPSCKISTFRNEDGTRISVSYEPSCQTTVAGKANSITKIIGLIDLGDGSTPQTLDLINLTSPQILPGTVEPGESYMVQVTVVDSVEVSSIAETISSGDSPVMEIGRDGNTITFFGSSPESADENSVQIGKQLTGRVIFGQNNIKFNYNKVEMFHVGYDIFTDNTGTHAFKTFVFGDENIVKGTLSSAFGAGNHITGDCGVALGAYNVIRGVKSTAIGWELKASGHNQTVVGQYNIEDTTNKYSFIVGNGTNNTARSNALAVSKLGDVEINGKSVNNPFMGEVFHYYGNNETTLTADKKRINIPAFTSGGAGSLSDLYTRSNNFKITVRKNGVYAIMARVAFRPYSAGGRAEFVIHINDERIAMYASSMWCPKADTRIRLVPFILPLSDGDSISFQGQMTDANVGYIRIYDIMMYALDYEGKYR